MTLCELNHLLQPEALREAVRYATEIGAIHRKDMDGGDGSVRRVALHLNDDGTSYLVLHGKPFDGCEHDPEDRT